MTELARQASAISISIYLVIAGSEWIYLIAQPGSGVFFQPEIIAHRLRERWWSRRSAALVASTLRITGVRALPTLVVLSGSTLLFTTAFHRDNAALHLICLLSLLICHAVFSFGLEGADQMAVFVLVTQTCISFFPQLAPAFQGFLTLQLTGSYVVAGFAKLLSPSWRRCSVLPQLLARQGVPHPWHLHKPGVCLLTWGIIIFELAWLAAPFELHLLYAIMAAGVLFHITIAANMGLNLFPWAFFAAYPYVVTTVASWHIHPC